MLGIIYVFTGVGLLALLIIFLFMTWQKADTEAMVLKQIDKMIGADRVPEPLRVPDLLADWVERI